MSHVTGPEGLARGILRRFARTDLAMKRIFLTLLPLALAACASTTPPAQSGPQVAADNGTICERDSPTGSMLPKTRCTTAAEREATQRSTQAVSEAVRNQRSAPPGKGS